MVFIITIPDTLLITPPGFSVAGSRSTAMLMVSLSETVSSPVGVSSVFAAGVSSGAAGSVGAGASVGVVSPGLEHPVTIANVIANTRIIARYFFMSFSFLLYGIVGFRASIQCIKQFAKYFFLILMICFLNCYCFVQNSRGFLLCCFPEIPQFFLSPFFGTALFPVLRSRLRA